MYEKKIEEVEEIINKLYYYISDSERDIENSQRRIAQCKYYDCVNCRKEEENTKRNFEFIKMASVSINNLELEVERLQKLRGGDVKC